MFGFGKGKLRKELEELERTAEEHRFDLDRRQSRADLTAHLHGEEAALPLYEAIVADFPHDRRPAYELAVIRFAAGDPEPMERFAAQHPGYAYPCYMNLYDFHDERGDVDGAERIAALRSEALHRQIAAEDSGQLLDPGGPLEPPDHDEATRAMVRAELAKIRGLELLLAGKRTLDTGHRQEVVFYRCRPGTDGASTHPRVSEAISTLGDTTAWRDAPEWEWLHEALAELPGSQLYP